MRTERAAGLILIAGAIGFVVTMVFHPTGGTARQVLDKAMLNTAVHALGMVSVGVIVIGYVLLAGSGLARRPYSDAGVVAFVVVMFSGILAATLNGIVIHSMAAKALEATPEQKVAWNALFAYNHFLNAALAQVLMGAASFGVMFWSAALWGERASHKGLGVAGFVLGIAGLALLFSGRIQVNVHDFALFVFAMAAWIVVAGIVVMGGGPAPMRETSNSIPPRV